MGDFGSCVGFTPWWSVMSVGILIASIVLECSQFFWCSGGFGGSRGWLREAGHRIGVLLLLRFLRWSLFCRFDGGRLLGLCV